MKKILILGKGNIGWMFEQLLRKTIHSVIVSEINGSIEPLSKEHIKKFNPDIVLNCVSMYETINAFNDILPYITKDTILVDVASVKKGLKEFYADAGFNFVSMHPLFSNNSFWTNNHSKIIIVSESSPISSEVCNLLFGKANVSYYNFTFDKHDEIMTYLLSAQYISSLILGGFNGKTGS